MPRPLRDADPENLFGALTLLFADEQMHAVQAVTGLQPGAVATLVTIGQAPGQPIDFVARVLRRSHSSVVRLVATLSDQGLVHKGAGTDGRVVTLELTDAGARVARLALDRRGAVLADGIALLDESERAALTAISWKLLNHLARDEWQAMRICRLCDGDACVDCPVEAAFDTDATDDDSK